MLIKLLKYATGLTLFALLVIVALQTHKIQNLTISNNELKHDCGILEQSLKEEQSKFKLYIESMNNQIKNYELDLDSFKDTVKEQEKIIERSSRIEEQSIKKELIKDSSSEKQLQITKRILDEFASKNN